MKNEEKAINHIIIHFNIDQDCLVDVPFKAHDCLISLQGGHKSVIVGGAQMYACWEYDSVELQCMAENESKEHNYQSLLRMKEYQKSGQLKNIMSITLCFTDGGEFLIHLPKKCRVIESNDKDTYAHILWTKE